MSAVDRFLASPWRATGLVVCLALALRLTALAALHDGPFVRLHHWTETDMAFFASWARRIADGDLLSVRQPRHPQHDWHRVIAAAYLSARGQPVDDEATAALWERWYGGPRLHQEPLYPYLLALAAPAAAPAAGLPPPVPWPVLLAQLALGVWSVALIATLARRWAGPRAGLLAALLALGYAPLVVYDLVLLRTTLVTALTLWLVDRLDRAAAGGPRAWALAGVAGGLCVLTKTTALPIVLGGLPLCWVRPDDRRRRLLAYVGAFALTLAPLVARNLAAGAPPLSASSVGAITFVVHNVPGTPPGLGWWPDPAATLPAVAGAMGESDGALLPAAWHSLRRHGDVGSVAAMVAGKAWAALWWYEIPNNVSVDLARALAPRTIGLLPVDFGLLVGLAVPGLIALLRRGERRPWPLLLGLAATALPLVAFYVLARFRVPLAALLCPLAAAGLADLGRRLADGRWTGAALLALLALGATAATWRPLPTGRPAVRPADHQVAHDLYFTPAIAAAETPARALAVSRRSVALAPRARPLTSRAELEIAALYLRRLLAHQELVRRQAADADARRRELAPLTRQITALRAAAERYLREQSGH